MERLCYILVCLLSLVCPGVRGEQAEPALFKPGTDAALRWSLPPSGAVIITIARRSNGQVQPLFYCNMKAASIQQDSAFQGRIDILDSLGVGNGLVSFTLKNVSEADAGRYVCIDGFGDEPIIEDCGQMMVVVGQPTGVAVVSADGPAVEGRDLTLECAANTTSLPPDHALPLRVQWFDADRKALDPGGGHREVMVQGPLLIVPSVQRRDLNLRYSCRASDGLDVWSDRSASYVLVPEYAPRESDIAMDRREAEVSQGGSLQVQCSATCNPHCAITWEKEEAQERWYAVEGGVEGVLDVTGIQRSLAGNLRCRAENSHGSASQLFHLVVHYPPNLQQLTINGAGRDRALLKENANVTLACQFDSSPAPSVRWVKVNGKKLTLKTDDLQGQAPRVERNGLQRSLFVSRFELRGAGCGDTGRYKCSARNQLGSGRDGEAELHIACMPRNTYGDLRLREMYLLSAQDSLIIKFQVEAYPHPKVTRIISEDESGRRQREFRDTWIASATHTSSHPYLTDLELRMHNPIATYFDRTFYLDIENSEGTKTLAFKLREKGVPKAPRNVTSVWREDTWLRLQWLPGFHGGKPQTFVVQYQDAQHSQDGAWVTVPLEVEDTEQGAPQEVEVGGLQPGHSYSIRVVARNQYGNSSSAVITVTTLATAAASADGGAIAGAVIAVIVILIIVIVVLVFIFVIRPRRRKLKGREDFSREPMLTNGEKNTNDNNAATTVVMTTEEEEEGGGGGKPDPPSPTDTANNNADRDSSTEPLMSPQTAADPSPDDRPRNQDGLIYADLDLAKPKDAEVKPVTKDRVNYETIDFTRKPPPTQPDPDTIELASDEEELPSQK